MNVHLFPGIVDYVLVSKSRKTRMPFLCKWLWKIVCIVGTFYHVLVSSTSQKAVELIFHHLYVNIWFLKNCTVKIWIFLKLIFKGQTNQNWLIFTWRQFSQILFNNIWSILACIFPTTWLLMKFQGFICLLLLGIYFEDCLMIFFCIYIDTCGDREFIDSFKWLF